MGYEADATASKNTIGIGNLLGRDHLAIRLIENRCSATVKVAKGGC